MQTTKHQQARIQACLFLKYIAFKKQLSYAQIADTSGFAESNISRMLNGKYAITYDNLLKLAEAIDENTYNNLQNIFKHEL